MIKADHRSNWRGPQSVAGLLLGIGLCLLPVFSARADCTDAPRPGAVWIRCFMNERDFSGIDISNGTVQDSSFNRAILTKANLSEIDGRKARFVSASMQQVDLSGSDLVDADFTKADLQGADFSNADLRGARLFRADLKGATLTGVRLDDADMYRADLSGATWTDGKTVCGPESFGTCK